MALLIFPCFEEHDGTTKMTDTSHSQTIDDRDGMLESGMEEGATETMDRLAELVEKSKQTVKMNFFQGAFLEDPHKLFNAGLAAKKTRAIDFREGDAVDESALKELIRAAVAHNVGGNIG